MELTESVRGVVALVVGRAVEEEHEVGVHLEPIEFGIFRRAEVQGDEGVPALEVGSRPRSRRKDKDVLAGAELEVDRTVVDPRGGGGDSSWVVPR